MEFLAFLSSSSEGLFGEPREYGPLRCVDAMRRFIDILIELNLPLEENLLEELKDLRNWIDRDMHLLMYDPDKFKEFIMRLNKVLAEKTIKYLK
ncbi:MAG: DUF6092 family protein [Sulfolobales archaeon]